MTEDDLLTFLNDKSANVIRAARIDIALAWKIKAHTGTIFLSRDTLEKQIIKHRCMHESPERSLIFKEYVLASYTIEKGEVYLDNKNCLIFLTPYLDRSERYLKVVVKVTKNGSELYLVSTHPIREADYRSIQRKYKKLDR